VRLNGPGGEWSGGEQQVASLPDGYLEIQQLVDPELGHVLASRVADVPFVAVLAWLSENLETDLAELTAAGVDFTPIADWSRHTIGGLARFRFASVRDDSGPLRVIVQHHDPHLTRQPTPTANGVIRVRSVRREDDVEAQPVDTADVSSTVALLKDARPVTSIVFDCADAETLAHLSRSGWTVEGSSLRSRADLGADLEMRWN
jgi:hypothetical protein